MFLALPLMAVCLYISPRLAPWYTGYVLLFNMLVGPVFSAGTITNERERQTLELLLCTTISPWQILWGKLISSLRVSIVLTSFLVWPLLLAWLLPPWTYWPDTGTMIAYVGIIALSSITTTTLAMFCSVIFRKTTVSMMTAYLIVIVLFALPVAVEAFAGMLDLPSREIARLQSYTVTSPFSAAFSLPLSSVDPPRRSNWGVCAGFSVFYTALNVMLLWAMLWLFNVRWRVRA